VSSRTVNLGFPFVPGSIRAVLDGVPVAVGESPDAGLIQVDVEPSAVGELKLTYDRRLLQGGGPLVTQKLGEVGACIYCGSTEDLSDEHLIPLALEGPFVLDRASCGACAKLTGRFEGELLRGWLLPSRLALNLKTRHPRKRPTTLVIETATGSRQVSVSEYPTLLYLPVFELPALVRGAADHRLLVRPKHVSINLAHVPLPALLARHGPGAWVESTLDPYTFAQLLAKIAHGFAVAQYGVRGFVSDVLQPMLFSDRELLGRYVGGAADQRLSDAGLHGVQLNEVDGVIHARIRLFAQLGGPEYLVVVGRPATIPSPGQGN
jgi:hypothetical protein